MTLCKVKIFLDESGIVREQKLGIMGALLIPEKVYNSRNFKELMDKFKINNITFHWNELSIHNKDKYSDLLSSLTPFYKFIHANFLLYHYQNFRKINDNDFKQMIYSKFPERVIYGLLRDNISFSNIVADIEIEHSSNYEKIELDKFIHQQLNAHSIYRGEPFRIESCKLIHKQYSFGLQITDCLIGVLRDIFLLPNKESKRSKEKLEFIYDLFKNINKFQSFLESLTLFEWKNSSKLHSVDIKKYIRFFLSNEL